MPTHRLAAILFADIVGYTAMMQANEADGIAKAAWLREVIHRLIPEHGGELIEMRGDGALCMFSSSVEAVCFAKHVQDEVSREIPLRIGIHAGDIVQREGHLFGDALNIASRIESMGIAGAVLVSETIRHQIKNKPEFELTSLGKFAFKNVAEPMTVYALANEGLAVPKPEQMKGKGERLGNSQRSADQKALVRGLLIGFIGLMAGVGLWLSLGYDRTSGDTGRAVGMDERSITVFGFENLSPELNEENEFFCKGITQDIRTHLSKLQAITIKGGTQMIEQDQQLFHAQEQGAVFALQGNVRRINDEIRVTANLIQVATNDLVWSESYDRTLTGVFEIQSDIAQNIAKALQGELSEQEKAALAPNGTDNLQAFKLFEQIRLGKYRTPEDYQRKIDLLEQVIEMDSTYAAAYALLGESYLNLNSWFGNGQIPFEEANRLARDAFEKAKQLNPYDESVYRRLMAVNLTEWDFEAAEQNVKRARELAPNAAGPLDYQRWLYTVLGRFEESAKIGERVMVMKPRYKWGNAHHGLSLYLDGQENRSKEVLLELVNRDSSYVSGVWRLAQVYIAQDSTEKAIALINACMSEARPAPLVSALGSAYASKGEWEEAERYVHELRTRLEQGENGYKFFISMIYGAGKDEANTLKWLEESYQDHEHEVHWLIAYPEFRFLHQHPQFLEIVHNIGLSL